jgi:hypothetical protein
MQTFVIRRRNAWKNARELEATAGVSLRIGNDEMADQIRWIRSYVVTEDDGTLGTVCIYQAVSEAAIREHARRVGMPAHEITPVANTVVIREDPKSAADSQCGTGEFCFPRFLYSAGKGKAGPGISLIFHPRTRADYLMMNRRLASSWKSRCVLFLDLSRQTAKENSCIAFSTS